MNRSIAILDLIIVILILVVVLIGGYGEKGLIMA
jgi:hypothetical protein